MNHNYSIESTHILSWTRKYPMSMLFLLFSISFQHSWKIFLALCAPEIFRTNRVKKYCVLARTPFATMQENKKIVWAVFESRTTIFTKLSHRPYETMAIYYKPEREERKKKKSNRNHRSDSWQMKYRTKKRLVFDVNVVRHEWFIRYKYDGNFRMFVILLSDFWKPQSAIECHLSVNLIENITLAFKCEWKKKTDNNHHNILFQIWWGEKWMRSIFCVLLPPARNWMIIKTK